MPTSESEHPVLQVEHVFGGYGGSLVLQDLSLAVRGGEIVTLIGANGAGKSTVLKGVFGIVRPREGRIHFNGVDVTDMKPLERMRLGMAYCPQGRCNFPRMTVWENLEVASYSCRDRRSVRGRLEQLFEAFPLLGERRRELAGNLSGGQQQIVELAMALVTSPSLLLVDEPSIGLAPLVVSDVLRSIQAINQAGVTVLMVEQNARRALEVSDVGVVLERGRVRLVQSAESMLADESVRASYLGAVLRRGA